ncbi:Hypothetical predicted protein, partial [Olea europaea subsp. europaea]
DMSRLYSQFSNVSVVDGRVRFSVDRRQCLPPNIVFPVAQALRLVFDADLEQFFRP